MTDMELDLDVLDGPIKAPARTTRFAPKGSKLKPQPKPQPKAEQTSSEPQAKAEPQPQEPPKPQESEFVLPKKSEELDSKPPFVGSATVKAEFKPSSPHSAADDTVKMEVDHKPDGEVPETEPMEEDDSEDCVVREIEVFFTPALDANTKLYVLQYPLRPVWRPYELDEQCEEVRVKTTTGEVELDLSFDVNSKNFDSESDLSGVMTKQTFSTSWKPTFTTSHAVGVLVGNKLYFSPSHEVAQLRPSMEYLKSGGTKKQNKQPGVLNEQNNDIGECWVPLKYHGSQSDVSSRYLQKMMANESSPIQFSLTPDDYFKSLCPGTSNNKTSKASRIRLLSKLPLEERYKKWLREEDPPVNRFDTLKHLAPDESDGDVFRVLQKYAQLVQGLWVPKTSLVYENSAGVEHLARDYVLLLFSKSHKISREKLNVPGLPDKLVNDVLKKLAVERPIFKDWKFKEPKDVLFIKDHPNIVREQEQAWARAENHILSRVFKGGRGGPGTNISSKPDLANRPATSKTSNKGVANSSSGALSRTPMSDETREALPKALQKLFNTHKVCSLQQICQRLREMAVSESSRPKGVAKEAIAAANGVDAPQEELLEIIGQVAINIHGVYVSKSSADHPQYDELRKVVINLLIAEGPNAKLKKASILEAGKIKLKRDITPNEYQKVLSELCVSQGSAWVLKSGDGNPK